MNRSMVLSFRINLLIIGAVFAPAILLAQESPKPTEKPKSPALERSPSATKEQASTYTGTGTDKLQRQSERLSDKRDALQDEINELGKFLSRAKSAQSALEKAQPPNLDVDCKRVADALDAMAALIPSTPIFSQINSAGGVFNDALVRLYNDASNNVVEIVRPALPGVRSSGPGPSRLLSPVEQIADEAASGFPDPRQTVFLSNFMPALMNLSNRINFQQGASGGIKRADLNKDLAAAQAEVKALGTLASNFFNEVRKAYAPILEAVVSGLQKASDDRTNNLNSISQQLADLEKELQTRTESVGKRQGALTDKLLYTEGMMILAIMISVFLLRFYSEPLAITMVQERTLGDLLGTGLLLITIIFLAVGDFVDKSALVTLLGTIAGYIFARRSTSTASSAVARSSAPAAPKNLQQVTPVVAGEVSVKCDPVEGAESYRWYVKNKGARGFVFREQTAEPHVTFTEADVKKISGVAVSASNGREGKRSAPIEVTATA